MHQVDDQVLLHLMQLGSSFFPSGGFSYSQGLEWAVHFGLVNSVDTFSYWQKQIICEQLTYLDWPMLKRMYSCIKNSDKQQLLHYIEKLLAYRETRELRLEEKERGQSIMRVLLQCSLIEYDSCWFLLCSNSMLASIALLGCIWGIPLKSLAINYGYIVVESLIMAGLKLIPFGQCTAQKLLMSSFELFPASWKHADLLTDDELGSSFPLQAIASSCHEIQQFRLFRS